MADIVENIAASGDDAHSLLGTQYLAATQLGFGNYPTDYDFTTGFRFTTIGLDQGVTIDLAVLKFNVQFTVGTPDVNVYGDDIDDAAVWSTSNRVSNITKTTASANYTSAATGNQQVTVTSIIQELVDRGGWASGQDMALAMFDNGITGANWGLIEAFDHAGTTEASLEIDFTAGPAPLVADSGSFTWTGTAADLEYNPALDANAGSYSWTGTAASLEYNPALTAEAGSYTWTGAAAGLEFASLLSAETGAYVWTGTDASLELGAVLAAEAGSFAWTGTAAALEYNPAIDAAAASYTWTGTAAGLIHDSILAADAGSYAWTGSDATLTLVQQNTLDAEAGSYAWTGTAAGLEYHSLLSADPGSYAWTGTAATLTYAITLDAEAASYVWDGQTATLLFDAMLDMEAGSFLWAGSDASLSVAGFAATVQGTISLNGYLPSTVIAIGSDEMIELRGTMQTTISLRGLV